MRKIWCTLLTLGSFAATVNAAPLDAPPPYAGDSETVRETLPPPKVVLEKKSPEEGMSLAPSEEDIRKAREDREKGVVPKVPEKRTKIEAVRDRMNRGEQSILFLNRRGYARVMICGECGFEARCPDCSVSYTYSKQRELLSCHLCGGVIPACKVCPQCGSEKIRYAGVGTEKIEAVAGAVFHPARIARMDSDTMRGADDYEIVLERFRRGELDILIGTQMIAKGLHFPNVTLVGIINADLGLTMPDFRANERTFQLITQVAGRAGRGDIRGEVIIQTYLPHDPVIRAVASHDRSVFLGHDLAMRLDAQYPPYVRLVNVVCRGRSEERTRSFADRFATEVRRVLKLRAPASAGRGSGLAVGDLPVVLGPASCVIERAKDRYRFHFLVKAPLDYDVSSAIAEALTRVGEERGISISVDVDPYDLM